MMGFAKFIIGPAHRVRPEPAVGPAKGRTRWAGPMAGSGRTRWLNPSYALSTVALLKRGLPNSGQRQRRSDGLRVDLEMNDGGLA